MKNTAASYKLIDTAGQITAVIDVPIPRSKQAVVAKPLMNQIKNIGQVCFIERVGKYPRLQMMGNELSVNGCAAGAFYWLLSNKKTKGTFETSGDGLIIDGKIDKNKIITITFPSNVVRNKKGNEILLAGINYFLIPRGIKNKNISQKQKKILKILAADSPASGIIYYSGNNIQPLIYVKATNTFVWETSCGSGSIAYAIISGYKEIIQPSKEKVFVKIKSKTITYQTRAAIVS